MNWDAKLKRLQDKLEVNADGLAGTLGITTRTLADFMKPLEDGGREPTGPVQKLISLLLEELDSPDIAKKPRLNLVVIHGDFRVPDGVNVVDAILDMHSEGGRQAQGLTAKSAGRSAGVNEFHYVTVEPERDAKWAIEGLTRRRIQPHFYSKDVGLDSEQARDIYFTTTAVWLAAQAMRRDLAHITLAADAKKFWPLARELAALADVDVTFVREAGVQNDDLEKQLQAMGIAVADPAGRKLGYVTHLANDYGFIAEGTKSKDQAVVIGSPLFFSWNHMRKDRYGVPEIEIGALVEGDYVSFSVGMNYKGPCATDVVLVERAPGAPSIEKFSAVKGGSRRSGANESELVEIVKDAVTVCADEDGWALSADVGSRIKVLHADFTDRLKASAGFQKISDLARANEETFEVSHKGEGTRYSASCMRLRPKGK
jgi:hypothetical protein